MTTAYALTNNSLLQFETRDPSSILATIPITGLGTGETLVGIDFRPQNGYLYGIASNGAGAIRLYAIDFRSGVSTPLSPAPVQFTDGNNNPVAILGSSFGFDFNPTVDRIRVVTDRGVNFRLNPNNGTIVDGNNGSTDAVPGLNPDGSVRGSVSGVDGTAYTNSGANSRVTTQYTLDSTTNQLLIQNPPNSGTQISPLPLTLNGSPLDFGSVNGFDILSGVEVATANAPAIGQGLAVLNVNGVNGLYAIDLNNGRTFSLGTIGNGRLPIQGFAVQNSDGNPIVGLDAQGTNLLRTNTNNVSNQSRVAITGITTGETLVGIDFRPTTGQLFGLGVNRNNGTLYVIDPQLGNATPVGPIGAIGLVNSNGSPVILPGSGYGFDFNPTVDRIRVTTASGLNFRLNPLTGLAVDGDTTAMGINPDGAISGISGGISGTAYTNSSGGATVTTQYTLDSGTNRLFIQNPPNSGNQIGGVGLSSLDFDLVEGFDIPPDVRVTTANTQATGLGYATLRIGTTSLYEINLTSGSTRNLGAFPASAIAIGDALGAQFFDLIGDGTPTQPIELGNIGFANLPVRGLGGNDFIAGTNANDRINGNQGNDTIVGGGGNDFLFGGKGDDLLLGGEGNDTLSGDIGRDTLRGELGSDLFVLRNGIAAATSASDADAVSDFDSGEGDRIGLTGGLTFASLVLESFILSGTSSTLIRSGTEFLGILQGISPSSLSATNFVTIEGD